MKYQETLKAAINKSGKTLSRISKECFLYGVDISPSYISKLQNGDQAPATDGINLALARVLGLDEEDFVLLAYREKIPPEILKKLAAAI